MPFGRSAQWLAGMMVAPALVACKPAPNTRHTMPAAAPERGLAAIKASGCGACHDIPGVEWPMGRIGPPLAAYGDRTLIAGRLPNRPDILARWVRNAPSLIPGTAMPAIPLSEEESRDVAAYLYTLGAR